MRLSRYSAPSLALAATLGMILAAPLALAQGRAQEGKGPGRALITVTGEGVAEAVPDLATIDVGVTTQGTTAAEAMAANTVAVQAVLDRLTASGTEARDMQTSNLALNPNWTSSADGTSSTISGYVASNQLTVRVRDLTKLGAVLDAVVTDGANTLNGISFGLQQPKPVQDAARKDAVADAKARAELLATAAGVTLGRLVSITEGGTMQQPQPMYRMDAAAAGAPVPVAGGEVGLTSAVTLVYELTE